MQASGERIIWSTEPPRFGIVWKHTFLKLKANGNLVLFNPFSDNLAEEKPIWESYTSGRDKKPFLVMQDDGNLVLYGSKFKG